MKPNELRKWFPRLLWACIAIGPSFVMATPASAATCTYDAPTRIVSIATQGTETILEAVGGTLLVNGVVCSSATITNTDGVNIVGTSGSEVAVISAASGSFTPGATDEGDGTSEIEFHVDLLDGNDDTLVIVGSFGNDILTTGTGGINLNDDFDPDVTAAGLEYLQVIGLGGNDTLSAAGGRGAGEPDTVTNLYGDSGRDLLTGGWSGDYLEGGAGKDRLRGGLGADELVGGGGNDSLVGGRGEDRLLGSRGRDVLRGGPGRDRLNGGDGSDSCYPGPAGGKTVFCEKPATELD
jgi:Ca2+-binding RTX toxin-like protein